MTKEQALKMLEIMMMQASGLYHASDIEMKILELKAELEKMPS